MSEWGAGRASFVTRAVLEAYAEDLCGMGYRLDQPVRDVAESTHTGGRMVGGVPARAIALSTAAAVVDGVVGVRRGQQGPPWKRHSHFQCLRELLLACGSLARDNIHCRPVWGANGIQ